MRPRERRRRGRFLRATAAFIVIQNAGARSLMPFRLSCLTTLAPRGTASRLSCEGDDLEVHYFHLMTKAHGTWEKASRAIGANDELLTAKLGTAQRGASMSSN